MDNAKSLQSKSVLRKAFTLVELLVVIAIIALLLSVLMPALSKAREQARWVVCGAQFHQIGLIQQLYANDFKSWLPKFTDKNTMKNNRNINAANSRVWPNVMLAESFEFCRKSYRMKDKIWVCPAFVGNNKGAITWQPGKEGELLKKSGGNETWPDGYWTVGVTSLVGLTRSGNIAPLAGVKTSAVNITDPGHYLLGADVNMRWGYDWKNPSSKIAHKGKNGLPAGSDVLHVDLSVTRSKPSEMAYKGQTINWPNPTIVPIDYDPSHNYRAAAGKYNEWVPDGRENYW